MSPTRRKTAGLIVIAIFLSGCATIITGTTQKVPVISDPSDAVAKADGITVAVTPCTFTLERKRDHTIEISKEGYKTTSIILRHTVSGAMAGNAIFGGLIGAGIDAGTGAMYKLVPGRVDVTLEPEVSVQSAKEAAVTETSPQQAQEQIQQPQQEPSQATPENTESSEAPAFTIAVKSNSNSQNPEYIEYVRKTMEDYLKEQTYIGTGQVCLNFIITPTGSVHDLKTVDEKTTGSEEMKQACIAAVNSLHPFIASVESMPKEPISAEMIITGE